MKKVKKTNHQRYMYFLTVGFTIVLGLASRRYGEFLPTFVANHAGDLLWAMMVYFGFRFLLVNKRSAYSFWLSIVFSYAIERSQLYQEEWIHSIRQTTFGALVLGQGFLVIDLIRYAAGVILAAVLDRGLRRDWKGSSREDL